MTILRKREIIKFDPSNAEHRKAYLTFVEKRSWSTLPCLFQLEEPHLDVVSMIESKLLKFYTTQEFSK